MPFHQEMSQLMGDGKSRTPASFGGVGENRACASDCIREQHSLKSIEDTQPNFTDIQITRDVDDRYGRIEPTKLIMNCSRQSARFVNIREVNAV
ncbi:hypothetical protein ACOI1H_23580 [Loktanella sp. DJP18]|uniref:hypothetical protein n=1 Tax=Loktanella sp. DJP18 TaxID=3409788 RepID=UPI003BB71AE9